MVKISFAGTQYRKEYRKGNNMFSSSKIFSAVFWMLFAGFKKF